MWLPDILIQGTEQYDKWNNIPLSTQIKQMEEAVLTLTDYRRSYYANLLRRTIFSDQVSDMPFFVVCYATQ